MSITTYAATPGRVRSINRHSDASAAATQLVLTTPVGAARQLIWIAIKYSAAPTHSGVTIELASGISSAYDTTINTPVANAQNTFFMPAQPIVLADTDAIRVTAPSGGGAITSQISIYTEIIQ